MSQQATRFYRKKKPPFKPFTPFDPNNEIALSGDFKQVKGHTAWELVCMSFSCPGGEMSGGWVERPDLLSGGSWVDQDSIVLGEVHLSDGSFVGQGSSIHALKGGQVHLDGVAVYGGNIAAYGSFGASNGSLVGTNVEVAGNLCVDLLGREISEPISLRTGADWGEFSFLASIKKSSWHPLLREQESQVFELEHHFILVRSVDDEWLVSAPFCDALLEWSDFSDWVTSALDSPACEVFLGNRSDCGVSVLGSSIKELRDMLDRMEWFMRNPIAKVPHTLGQSSLF